MSKLIPGSALSWEETQKWTPYMKEIGIQQFITIFNRHKDRDGDILTWGDEVEYTLIKFNNETQEAKVALKAHVLLNAIAEAKSKSGHSAKNPW